MKKNKDILYIFLHVLKCAGTTIATHLSENLGKDEVLFLYFNTPPFNSILSELKKKKAVKRVILSLPKERRKRIKVIFGHGVYYGIHELFPGREARYITFLRNPVSRTISHYNFQRTNFHSENSHEFKRARKCLLKDGNLLSFERWFLNNPKFHDFISNFLYSHFLKEDMTFDIQKDRMDKINFEKIKKILDRFYFVGLTENPEDFLFVYSLFGIRNFLEPQNQSKKYYMPENYKKAKRLFDSMSKFDMGLYDYALQLNRHFKEKHKDFYEIVKRMENMKLRSSRNLINSKKNIRTK